MNTRDGLMKAEAEILTLRGRVDRQEIEHKRLRDRLRDQESKISSLAARVCELEKSTSPHALAGMD